VLALLLAGASAIAEYGDGGGGRERGGADGE
jgi:hypothetical protein